MINRLLIAVVIVVGLTAAGMGQSRQLEFSVDETLKNAAFNTPHMPTQKAFSAKYGEGKIYRRPGRIYHVYYLPDLNLWLRCRGDSDAGRFVPISELMISKINLGTTFTPSVPVVDPNLKGIRVGDSIRAALAKWGEPLREYDEKLGSVTTKVYEFFPTSIGPGLCLRFFTRGDRKIVAFSFSSEE